MKPQSATEKTQFSGKSTHFDYMQNYLNLTENEINVILEIAPLLRPHLNEIIDRFYDAIVSSGMAHQFFPDAETVNRLKTAQYHYFCEILEAKFDDVYISKRRSIGQTHERIGLQPRWYIGAYSLYCEIIFPILRAELKDDAKRIEAAELALMKVFHLDMQLAMETYIERYSRELVDARLKLEQKLWMEDRLLTSIMSEASDAIVGLDEHGRISTWSQGAQRMFGFRTLEIVDKSLRDLICDPKQFDQIRKEAAAHGACTLYATEWNTKSGKPITADASLTQLRNERGNVIGATLILRDTTEIRQLANKLKNMEQIHAMTKITAGVAHEIRTPLGVMALTADMIGDRVQQCLDAENTVTREPIQAELFDMLSDLQKEVDRMNEIVNHYLVLSRIQKPKRALTPLNRFLQDIYEEIQTRIRRDNIHYQFVPAVNAIDVEIDTDHFRRLLLNLFENSAYALSDGGTITIKAEQVDNQAVIEVQDTGKGISKEMIDKVFNAFETGRPGGTGLGLYLAREIAVAHGGEIQVKSELGRGTSIIIQLPIPNHENIQSAHE
ncbi:MAG: protoglobin domain-containing protein [Candidatus Hinthialibacter antarcticus]|nr:protoglobin domain-containing protein [Candidatus Hinthialibacter antarcticus]